MLNKYDLTKNPEAFDWSWGSSDYRDAHFKILSTSQIVSENYEVLIFTDSKGTAVTSKEHISWTEALFDYFASRGMSCLLISRPKLTTVFYSLLQFLAYNPIKFKYLITNVGFVDLTPSRIEFINEVVVQAPVELQRYIKYKRICDFKVSSGEIENLNSFKYCKSITRYISDIISKSFDYSLLIATLDCSNKIKIERKRPDKFYSQLKKTNKFIFNISNYYNNLHYVQPFSAQPANTELLTYDAVHFTRRGHIEMVNIIKPYCNFLFI